MIKEEDYLKAKQIVQEYEKQLNISGVSVNKVEFCTCGNPSGGLHCYVDGNIVECADCGKQVKI